MVYNMNCLICGHADTNLVRIQEHVMLEHGYSQEDLQKQSRKEIEPGHYKFSMPDGTPWLEAKRRGGNVVSGL